MKMREAPSSAAVRRRLRTLLAVDFGEKNSKG